MKTIRGRVVFYIIFGFLIVRITRAAKMWWVTLSSTLLFHLQNCQTFVPPSLIVRTPESSQPVRNELEILPCICAVCIRLSVNRLWAVSEAETSVTIIRWRGISTYHPLVTHFSHSFPSGGATDALLQIKEFWVVCFKSGGVVMAVQHKYLEAFLSVHTRRLLSPLPAWADGFLLRLWSVAKVGGSSAGGEGSSNKLWEAGYGGPLEARESPEKGSGCGCVCVCAGSNTDSQTEQSSSCWASVIRHMIPHRDLINICQWSHAHACRHVRMSLRLLVGIQHWLSSCLLLSG